MENTTHRAMTKNRLKMITTHSIVAAIIVNPYLLYILADMYKISTGDMSEVVVNHSLYVVMSLLSALAFVIAIGAFILSLQITKK